MQFIKRNRVLSVCYIYLDQILILCLVSGFLIKELSGLSWLNAILSVFVFALIMVNLPKITGFVQILSVAFLVIGVTVMLYHHVSLQTWQQAATLNVTLITLFAFAPMFGIPVRSPVYVSALQNFYYTSIKGSISFFIISQLLTQILAVFLNVGSISVVHHLASMHRSSRSWRILSNALNRGFAAAILWSPYFAAMAVVTHALHVTWIELLPYLLGFFVITFFISLMIERPHLRKRDLEETAAAVEDANPQKEGIHQTSNRKLVSLLVYLLLAMAIILVLEQSLDSPMVIIISLTAIFYPMLWCIGSRSFDFYKQGVKEHVTKSLPALKKEMVLFLTAGFFSGAVGQTHLSESFLSLLSFIPIPMPVAFTICSLLLIVLTSSIGSHPIILITILSTTINPASVGITPIFFAILLLGSWSISNLISPTTAVNNVLSIVVHKNVFDLIKVNYKYTMILVLILPLYLFLIGV